MNNGIVYRDRDTSTHLEVFDSPSAKEREAELFQRIGNETARNGIWDSDWLMKKYPSRFEMGYLREQLEGDQYDPALYTENDEDV
ncbi:MAG: hypothetical protein ACON43_03535 [Flavobacteriaceae bacterium]